MKSFLRSGLLTLMCALAMPALAVNLDKSNKDSVLLQQTPYWNLQILEATNTTYKLTSKNGTPLGGANYGEIGIGQSVFEVAADNTLTQGACNTLWGSATAPEVAIYAGWANSQGTSVSNTSPSTNISGGSDTNFKIAVDKNPVVSVTLTLTGLSTGAAIATGLTSQINAALAAAGQGGRVDVAYGTVYTLTSRLKGARSSVVVTAGASADVADDLKIGTANSGVETAGFSGTQLCVSDVAGKSTVGTTAIGSSGYVSCGATVPSGTAIRQVATADLNCTGPVIGTVKEYTANPFGYSFVPVKKFGQVSSTTTGTTALVFAVRGLESTSICTVSPIALGAGVGYLKSHAVTANTITATSDANQTSGTTTINYICW